MNLEPWVSPAPRCARCIRWRPQDVPQAVLHETPCHVHRAEYRSNHVGSSESRRSNRIEPSLQ
eukprot:8235923-Alexandrium_andersonii.AAC.1